MLMKLLLTALVIAGALMFLRRRARRLSQPAVAPQSVQPVSPAKSRLPHIAAYSVLFVMLAGAIFFVYLQWQDDYRVVSLRVIDSRTGKITHYQVRKGDVEGRHFRTIDGKDVTLAEVERLEMGGH